MHTHTCPPTHTRPYSPTPTHTRTERDHLKVHYRNIYKNSDSNFNNINCHNYHEMINQNDNKDSYINKHTNLTQKH